MPWWMWVALFAEILPTYWITVRVSDWVRRKTLDLLKVPEEHR